jgi:hypothetical protein
LVRHDNLGTAPELLNSPGVSTDPAGESLVHIRLYVGVAAGAQHGDENRRFPYFAGLPVDDLNCCTGPVDKHLLPGPVLLANDHIHLLAPETV